MHDLLKLSKADLENIVAAAPYSQLHQMVLAMKNGNAHNGTLYEFNFGEYQKLEKKQEEYLHQSIFPNAESEVVTPVKKPIEVQTSNTKASKSKSESKSADITQKKKEGKKKKGKKIKSRKKNNKKSKKKKEKVKVYSTEENLSPYTMWLLSKSDSEVKEKKARKKKKKESEKSVQKDSTLVSEPLANLLVSQGHLDQAIDMYKKLSLIFPEKSSFFASKIEEIKNKL